MKCNLCANQQLMSVDYVAIEVLQKQLFNLEENAYKVSIVTPHSD